MSMSIAPLTEANLHAERVAVFRAARGRAVAFANQVEGVAALQQLGLSAGQAAFLAGLQPSERAKVVPSPDALALATEHGTDAAGLVAVLAAQAGVLLPPDWSGLK